MWIYEKKLACPVKIDRPCPKTAKLIITQYGGPDGELGAALRYLSQRFSTVTSESKALLTDVGTEELAHLEIVCAMVQQLTKECPIDMLKAEGFDSFYVEHGTGIFPSNSAGVPFSANGFQSKGDPITDMYENLAAEQKARSTYEYLLDMCQDRPDVMAPLRFLREREIVHFQRFGEALNRIENHLGSQNYFYMCEDTDATSHGSYESMGMCAKADPASHTPHSV